MDQWAFHDEADTKECHGLTVQNAIVNLYQTTLPLPTSYAALLISNAAYEEGRCSTCFAITSIGALSSMGHKSLMASVSTFFFLFSSLKGGFQILLSY